VLDLGKSSIAPAATEAEEASDAPEIVLIAPEIAAFPDPVAEAMAEDIEEIGAGTKGEASRRAEPFDLTGMQAGDEMGDEDDDVDGIVDPLAGLRGAEDDDDATLAGSDEGGFGSGTDETLDLGLDDNYAEFSELAEDDHADGSDEDDLLAEADRLGAENKPVEARLGGGRRRGILGGSSGEEAEGSGDSGEAGAGETGARPAPASGGGGGSGSGGGASGSTLFERMANLSRSSSSKDEDDEDGDGDDAPALSIPRFLGRQNNQ
jgi:cell division protein FtsZ